MDNLIFYYSGTGNSLYDAISIGKELGNTKLVSMKHIENRRKFDISCKTLGFIFPVHFGNIPELAKAFMEDLNIIKAEYIYGVILCSRFEMKSILALRGLIKDKGNFVNYVKLHVNVNSNICCMLQNRDSILENVDAEHELDKIVRDIYQRKDNRTRQELFMEKVYSVLPNKRIGRKIEGDKGFILNEFCNHCGICVEVCGVHNIQMKEGRITFLHHCDQCFACIQYCPKEAIDIRMLTENRKRYHHPLDRKSVV